DLEALRLTALLELERGCRHRRADGERARCHEPHRVVRGSLVRRSAAGCEREERDERAAGRPPMCAPNRGRHADPTSAPSSIAARASWYCCATRATNSRVGTDSLIVPMPCPEPQISFQALGFF